MAIAHELSKEELTLVEQNASLTFDPNDKLTKSFTYNYSEGVQHGVVAARRRVSPSSYPLFEQIVSRIESGLPKSTSLMSSKDLGVSVLSYYQLRSSDNVPSTNIITEQVSTASETIFVPLGKLAFLGKRLSLIGKNDRTSIIGAKLVLELDAPELVTEAQNYMEQYAIRGISLKPYPGDQKYHPHCSLARIIAPAGYFKDPSILDELNSWADLKELGSPSLVELEPVRRPTAHPD